MDIASYYNRERKDFILLMRVLKQIKRKNIAVEAKIELLILSGPTA